MVESTEVPFLAKALGGLLPRHVYHFHGEPGVGKTVLGIQVTHAWLQSGRRVLYLTADRPQDLLEQAAELGLPLDAACRDGHLVLCETVDSAARQLAGAGVETLLERLDDLRQETPLSAAVIDPLDVFIARRTPRESQRRILSALVDGLQARGWTTLLLSGDEMLRRNSAAAETLLELCWATCALKRSGGSRLWRRAPREGAFVLEIERARQAMPSGRRLAYEIVRGAGLIPAPEEAAESSELGVAAAARRGRPRILLASAEREIFLPLTGLLQRTVETDVVADGVEALTRAVTWNPDVLVAETQLPRLSGFAVSRVLRQGRYAMPVILVSRAARRHSERVRAYLNGATDFLFFPLDMSEMVYKVRVAGEMRLHTFQEGVEEHLLEVLLSKAHSHVLDLPIFLQAMGLSLQSGVRFSSPVSLVTFWLVPTAEGGMPDRAWGAFRAVLDGGARAGDLLCFPGDRRAAILLCHETQRGAASFVRRLRRRMLAEHEFTGEPLAGWSIATASRTLHIPEESDVVLPAILDEAFTGGTQFYTPGLTDEDGGGQVEFDRRRWGT